LWLNPDLAEKRKESSRKKEKGQREDESRDEETAPYSKCLGAPFFFGVWPRPLDQLTDTILGLLKNTVNTKNHHSQSTGWSARE